MENVVLTIHLILALLLIGVVLLQRSEGGGLMSGGGAMSARGTATALGKLTWIFAAGFIATSITLTILASQRADSGSVADQIGVTNTAPAAPATEGGLPTGSELLPPVSTDAPATPPAAEN